MPRTNAHLRRALQDADMLERHYRAIGPAAILAALLCMPRKKAPRARVIQEAV